MIIKTKKKLNSLNLLCAIIIGLYGAYSTFFVLKALGSIARNPLDFVAMAGFAAFLDLSCYGYFKNKPKLIVIGSICEIVALVILNIGSLRNYQLWFIIITTCLEIAYYVLLIIVVKKKETKNFKLAIIAAACILVDWISFGGTQAFMAIVLIAVAVLIGITFSNYEEDRELIEFDSIKRSIDSLKKKKNKISTSKAADEIKSLKELLDAGTITKKEFQEKKEDILKKL